MGGVFAAFGTIFRERQFIRSIDLVFLAEIVLGFTNCTNQSEILAGAFFSHGGIVPRWLTGWQTWATIVE